MSKPFWFNPKSDDPFPIDARQLRKMGMEEYAIRRALWFASESELSEQEMAEYESGEISPQELFSGMLAEPLVVPVERKEISTWLKKRQNLAGQMRAIAQQVEYFLSLCPGSKNSILRGLATKVNAERIVSDLKEFAGFLNPTVSDQKIKHAVNDWLKGLIPLRPRARPEKNIDRNSAVWVLVRLFRRKSPNKAPHYNYVAEIVNWALNQNLTPDAVKKIMKLKAARTFEDWCEWAESYKRKESVASKNNRPA